jgi:hypothetical protein
LCPTSSGRTGFFAGNDLLTDRVARLVGAQILAVLLARSSSDETRLVHPT